jgi:aminoglycoside phosphotransferase family enzyme/predicted kinase
MSEKLIQALLSPVSYPHPTLNMRLVETHISWVILTGEFAYKIKKPVNFGFLDFSTLALRKYYCDEELRLNSRFSTGLYLAVVPITGSEDQPVVDGCRDNDGDVLDYAVKMRQFDQGELLEQLALTNALGIDDISSLAKKLADFHLHGAARLPHGERELGSVESVVSATLENFEQIAPRLTTTEQRLALASLRQWSVQQLAELQDVLVQRRAQGFVRECHGDLHLRNIARLDGIITFFDCIEFNAQFRWIDVQSELAFLLMDMEEKQLQGLSNQLLNTWLEYTGDYAGLAVLRFYKVYRAMVRAKVMVLKVDASDPSSPEAGKLWQEYATYIRLAQSCCQPHQAFLGLMHGVSGTGKSTVAATLASEFNAIRIRSDVERKRLFGLAPDARSEDEEKLQLYSEAASIKTFAALETLAKTLLNLGYPVLVDATFIAARWRRLFQQLANVLQLPFVILDCQATQATILQRLALRQATRHDASEADTDVMRRQLASVEPFLPEEQMQVLVIDTEQTVNAGALRKFLEKSR